jgi:hypothetical protein
LVLLSNDVVSATRLLALFAAFDDQSVNLVELTDDCLPLLWVS